MPTYPLPTLAATVSPTGISAPSYADIYASLQATFKAIYGSDSYIDADSQDGQLLAVVARAVADANSAFVAAYNSYSPATAQGVALSAGVKLNGIRRQVATNSTCPVQVVGQSGATIINGVISDVNGDHQWSLPASVTIPPAGTITVTATCKDLGAIIAPAGTLITIATPSLGWQSVTNAVAATLGAPVETDAALRRRQAAAAAQPSGNNVTAVLSSLAQIIGVTGVAVHENATGTTDAAGVPAHSIAAVVNGGTDAAVASVIALKKSPGCTSFGTTSILTADPNGLPLTVSFSRPANVAINVVLNVKALNGWSTTVLAAIQANVAAAINGLGIGTGLVFNNLWAPANLVGLAGQGTFQITTMTVNGATSDIALAYNQIATSGTVTVNAT